MDAFPRRRVFLAVPLTALVLWLWVGTPAHGQGGPSEAAVAGARAVIEAQMEAFKRDDGPAAYAFASPRIKEMFPTPEIFMEMVRTQFAPVYRPRFIEYKPPHGTSDDIMQPLILTGADGVTVLARYALRRQADGSWRIRGGVTLSPAPDEAPL